MNYDSLQLDEFIINNLSIDHPVVVAIEQREFIWDSINIIQLLDSICREIPLGTIILGKGEGLDAEKRMYKELSDSTIYDGQQRIMSLKKVFIDRFFELPNDKLLSGKRCRVWVDIANFKEIIKAKDNVTDHYLRIKNKGAETGCFPFEIIPEEIVDYKDLDQGGEVIQRYVKRKRTFRHASKYWRPLSSVLNEVGSEPKGIADVRCFMQNKMASCKICICRIGNETDIENLFLRINRAGKAVSDDEQYFARIKQQWPRAEQNMKGLHGEGTAFGLLDAVRMIVYLAHNIEIQGSTLKKKDKGVYLNLRLRDFDKSIVDKIQIILRDKKKIEDLVRKCTAELVKNGLNYGVRLINKKLLAMSIASISGKMMFESAGQFLKGQNKEWQALAKYLFVLDQSGVLSSQRKDKGFRQAFSQLWKNPFPLELLSWEEFQKRCNENDLDKLLWLAVFQKIPFNQSRGSFDIDHIIPKAWIKRRHGFDGALRQAVDFVGNMWIVGSEANRRWQQYKTPEEKYSEIKDDPSILVGCELTNVEFARSAFNGISSSAKLKEMQETVREILDTRTESVKKIVYQMLCIK